VGKVASLRKEEVVFLLWVKKQLGNPKEFLVHVYYKEKRAERTSFDDLDILD